MLIEDGSKDDSLKICFQLVEQHKKVKLYQHPAGMNLGASESRNLGIKMAKFDFISFLDADDLYNKGRFAYSERLFQQSIDVEGIYECAQYYREAKVYSIKRSLPFKKLFHYLLRGTYGHFHTNAVTLRKSVFEKAGFFNPALRLHQDAEIWLRLAFSCKMIAGNLETPVAFIRRHDGNRIWRDGNYSTRLKAYRAFYEWAKEKNLKFIDKFFLARKIAKLENSANNRVFLLALFRYLR